MKSTIKQIRAGLLVIISVAVLSSCSDFLDSNNPSAVTDDYYNTKNGQTKLVQDINAHYRQIFNCGEVQYYGTDLYMAVTESPAERMFNGYDKTFNSTAPIVGDYWKNLYKIVQESNVLLNRCTPDIAGDEYSKLVGQTRFFRALAYYYLVETFGPVPFLVEENDGAIEETERTDEQTIYSFIVSELEDVKDTLPMTTVAAGEVTNAAVIHFLGKVYLTRAYKDYAESNDFSNAAKTLDLLIDNPESGYLLQSSYKALFDENNQANSEVIWAIQYGNDKNYKGGGNPQQAMFGFNIVALESDLFVKNQKDYSAEDRKYWVNPKAHELFKHPVVDTRYDVTFKRKYYVNNSDNENYGQLGLYFPRWNDESNDTQGAIKYYPFKNDGDYVWYPQSTALPILESGSDRLPIIQKFQDTSIQWGEGGSREDVIFRLGDTYLLAAEAYLGAGNTDLALARINSIRQRAAKDDNSYQMMKLDYVDLDIIMDERGRELLGEHDRWLDLKRTRTLITRAYAYNPFVVKYDNLNENYLVRPIPQDEIDKVKGLTQNKGY